MSMGMNSEQQAKAEMDNMYRWTRHVYDFSRKYYLLGRDKLISQLNAQDGENICEVGCGTARNLIKMARRYPQAHFHGLDASDEMLKTARVSVEKAHIHLPLVQAFAQSFDPQSLFGLEKPLDKIVFSYSLSIIPPWKESIDHALELLPLGGEIHIVDFGSMVGQPAWFRKLIFWFLDKFHVYHKPEILEHLNTLQAQGKGILQTTHLYKGYSYMAVFTKA